MKSVEKAKKEYQRIINPPKPKRRKKDGLSLARDYLLSFIDGAIHTGRPSTICPYVKCNHVNFTLNDIIEVLNKGGYDFTIKNDMGETYYNNYTFWNDYCSSSSGYFIDISGWAD